MPSCSTYAYAAIILCPPSNFIFKVPLESQQSAMIAEFGQRVNLAAISLNAVIQVLSQRRGFVSKSSNDFSYNRREPEGGLSSKFICYNKDKASH
ncbi:MAG TPA: phosphosulfolactate synthase [Nitrososphaeraceae archaeon]